MEVEMIVVEVLGVEMVKEVEVEVFVGGGGGGEVKVEVEMVDEVVRW